MENLLASLDPQAAGAVKAGHSQIEELLERHRKRFLATQFSDGRGQNVPDADIRKLGPVVVGDGTNDDRQRGQGALIGHPADRYLGRQSATDHLEEPLPLLEDRSIPTPDLHQALQELARLLVVMRSSPVEGDMKPNRGLGDSRRLRFEEMSQSQGMADCLPFSRPQLEAALEVTSRNLLEVAPVDDAAPLETVVKLERVSRQQQLLVWPLPVGLRAQRQELRDSGSQIAGMASGLSRHECRKERHRGWLPDINPRPYTDEAQVEAVLVGDLTHRHAFGLSRADIQSNCKRRFQSSRFFQ